MFSAFPLILIPLIVFNLVGLGAGGGVWSAVMFSAQVPGATFAVTWGDLMVILGLIMLFFETLKAAKPAVRTIPNHIASTGVFILFLIEFILALALQNPSLAAIAANISFLIVTLIALFDVIAGFTISIRTAQRDVTYSRTSDPI